LSISPQTLLVSFSGIDGAGKSTQIINLQSRLEDMGLHVGLLTFWDDVVALKKLRQDASHKLFSGDEGVGTPEAPIHRRDKNIQSPMMTIVRLFLYFMDAISLRKKAHEALQSGADIVIFDRYIYDELANLNLRNPVMRFYIRLLMKLAPAPRISFVLDADPEQAHSRKPEYPIDFIYSNRASYLTLSRLLGNMTVIPPLSIPLAKAEVEHCVLQQIALQNTEASGIGVQLDRHVLAQPLPMRSRSTSK
jgi:thymidylate kinase